MTWFFLVAGFACVVAGIWYLMFPGKKGPSDPHQKRQGVHEKYTPVQTRYEAAKETKASLARTGLLQQTSQEARAVTDTIVQEREATEAQLEKDATPRRFRRQEELEEANHALTLYLTAAALEQGVDVLTLLEFRKKAELDRLELDKQWKEAEQSLKGGFIYQLQAHQHLSLMTEYIGGLYERARQLKKQKKHRELQLIEEHIAFMEGDFRERQRLLQGTEQTNAQRSDSNSQPQGSYLGTVEGDSE